MIHWYVEEWFSSCTIYTGWHEDSALQAFLREVEFCIYHKEEDKITLPKNWILA